MKTIDELLDKWGFKTKFNHKIAAKQAFSEWLKQFRAAQDKIYSKAPKLYTKAKIEQLEELLTELAKTLIR